MSRRKFRRRLLKIEGRRRFEDMMDTEAAYLAGLVDGEGCVGVYRKRVKKYGYFNYFIVVQLGMATRLPRDLCEEWGGDVRIVDQRPTSKPQNLWRIGEQGRQKAVLQRIISYLRVKRRQAEIALEGVEILNKKPEGWKDMLEPLVEETRKLNKKGRRINE